MRKKQRKYKNSSVDTPKLRIKPGFLRSKCTRRIRTVLHNMAIQKLKTETDTFHQSSFL